MARPYDKMTAHERAEWRSGLLAKARKPVKVAYVDPRRDSTYEFRKGVGTVEIAPDGAEHLVRFEDGRLKRALLIPHKGAGTVELTPDIAARLLLVGKLVIAPNAAAGGSNKTAGAASIRPKRDPQARLIDAALELTRGNRAKAAHLLKATHNSLAREIKRSGD